MSQLEFFILALIITLSVPFIVWKLINFKDLVPLVVVQITSGLLLGPSILGYWIPELYQLIFNRSTIDALSGIAWWGVSLFVFLAGLELDVKQSIKNKKETLITAGFALGAPLILGCLFSLSLIPWGHWVGTQAQTWQFVMGIGMATAVTALPVLIMFMEKMNILDRLIGQKVLTYASLDDIAIWAVLTIILMKWQFLGYQILFLAVFCIVAYYFRKIVKYLHTDSKLYLVLIWLLATALAADMCGLHYTVGAFLAGATLDKNMFENNEFEKIKYAVILIMMPVFFLMTGLKTSWEIGSWVIVAIALLMVAIQLIGKHLGVWMSGKLFERNQEETNIIGWLLQTKGLIEIIFASILLDKGIITNQMFTVLLLMAVASTLLTVPMVAEKIKRLYKNT